MIHAKVFFLEHEDLAEVKVNEWLMEEQKTHHVDIVKMTASNINLIILYRKTHLTEPQRIDA